MCCSVLSSSSFNHRNLWNLVKKWFPMYCRVYCWNMHVNCYPFSVNWGHIRGIDVDRPVRLKLLLAARFFRLWNWNRKHNFVFLLTYSIISQGKHFSKVAFFCGPAPVLLSCDMTMFVTNWFMMSLTLGIQVATIIFYLIGVALPCTCVTNWSLGLDYD